MRLIKSGREVNEKCMGTPRDGYTTVCMNLIESIVDISRSTFFKVCLSFQCLLKVAISLA